MPKILVIDDDELICEMISSTLQMEGFVTISALDGDKGIEAARKHAPDLIICDVMMPTMDGFATLTAIRKDPSTATTPFIFLTGQTAKSDMRQGMDLGADDFLAKPIMVNELVAAIRTRLQKQELARKETERKLDELRVNLSLSLPHEIRTPLSGIIGFAEILRDDNATLKPDEISEMARFILKSTTRLGHLVENFLTYAQLQILTANPNKTTFVGKEASVILKAHIEESARKKAKEYERSNDLRLSVGTAEAAISTQGMKRIFEEIIDNALKFSKSGSAIEVTTEQSDHSLILRVRDHGVGIDAKNIGDIGAYKQFDRNRLEQQGSGLGIAITKHMVELYGGRFSIESEIGSGTTVTIELPRVTLS
ncbi:MAG: response regulator [Ignavibacteriales bacterium]|nr:response regulator [Ignavibacteriales bacterium]